MECRENKKVRVKAVVIRAFSWIGAVAPLDALSQNNYYDLGFYFFRNKHCCEASYFLGIAFESKIHQKFCHFDLAPY